MENKEIVSVKSELFDIDDNGAINKDKIIELLQDKRLNDDKKYFIKDLWKYNFDLDYNELITLFDEDEEYERNNEMLVQLKNLSNIKFNKSIDIFKEKNNLFVLYSLEKPERKSNRKKSLKKAGVKKSKRKTHKKNT